MNALLTLLVMLAAGTQGIGLALASSGMTRLGPGLLLLVAGAGLGGWAALSLGRRPGERSGVGEVLLALALAFFLPVLGPLGLAVVLAARRRGGPPAAGPGWTFTAPPQLPQGPLPLERRTTFGPGALEGILRHAADPELRLHVVLACRELPGQAAVPLLSLALRDPVDDVRLLAYAVLDGRERALQADIQALGSQAAPPHGRLAQLHWELAYQGLVQGELLAFALERALHHVRRALAERPVNAGLALLMGRILLRLGRLEEAAGALGRAGEQGMPAVVVAPYQAEIAFFERRRAEVQRVLGPLAGAVRFRPRLRSVLDTWVERAELSA
jgi:polysaccharide biosynthesis protein PelE